MLSTLATVSSQSRRVEMTAKASVMLRAINRRAMAILSAERNGDEADVRSKVQTLRIAEGGGVGEGRR